MIASTLDREDVFGRIGLHEGDIVPTVRSYPVPGVGEHGVGQVDADDLTAGTDDFLDDRKVQAGSAGNVDDRGTRAQVERLGSPQALGALGVAGHGIESGRDVVVPGLLAVCRDEAL